MVGKAFVVHEVLPEVAGHTPGGGEGTGSGSEVTGGTGDVGGFAGGMDKQASEAIHGAGLKVVDPAGALDGGGGAGGDEPKRLG